MSLQHAIDQRDTLGEGERLDFDVIFTGKSAYTVWWRVCYLEYGDWVYLDSGHVSTHRSESAAQAKAERLNQEYGKEL